MERYPESSARKLSRRALWSTVLALIAAGLLIVSSSVASAQVEPYSDESPSVLPLQLAATPADEGTDGVTQSDEGTEDEVLGKRVKKNKGDDNGGGDSGGTTEDDGELPELDEVAADIEDEGGVAPWFMVFGFLGFVLMLLFLLMKRRWDEDEAEELA